MENAAKEVDYNPTTGELSWKYKGHGRKIGAIGTTNRRGYVNVMIHGRNYGVHRLAFYISTGREPAMIDHIDRNPSNNKLSNLRECTSSENNRNRGKKSNCSSPYKGVCKSRGKWLASYRNLAKNRIFLGRFELEADAAKAYDLAVLEDNPETGATNFSLGLLDG